MNTLFSVISMYQYYPTLFDEMQIPPALDKDILTDNLMMELGELEVIYNDPDFMTWAIERWSYKEVDRWTKLYETTVLSYDPIENYNRVETSLETQTRDLTKTDLETRDLEIDNLETRNLSGNNLETRDLDGSSIESGSDSATKANTGFNEATFQDTEKNTNAYGKVVNAEDNGTVNQALTDTGTVTTKTDDEGTINRNGTDTGTVDNETTSTVKGNIGVTTSQQMIEQERKILEFNMYSYIIEDFKKRFCILVW